MINMIPSPGIIFAKLIEKDKTSLVLEKDTDSRIKYAEVIAMGKDVQTDTGAILHAEDYCKIGDKIYFFTYEGDYDRKKIDGTEYYMIRFQDVRGVNESS